MYPPRHFDGSTVSVLAIRLPPPCRTPAVDFSRKAAEELHILLFSLDDDERRGCLGRRGMFAIGVCSEESLNS